MRVVSVRLFVVCLGLAGLSAGLPARGADEPWLEAPFKADPGAALRASAAPLKGETEKNSPWFRMLLDESRWSFEPDGKFAVTRRRVLRILTHEGAEEMGSVSAGWKPWQEEPPLLRGRVIRPNGSVLLLDEKTISETPASSDPALFDDRRVLRAPLPGIEPGALVEWEIVKRRTAPPSAGALGSHLLAYGFPVGRVRCRVESPKSLPFGWKSLGLDLAPRVSLSNGRVVRLWERVTVPPLEDVEEDLPPEIPANPVVEFGTGTSWSDVADRYRTWVEGRMAEGPPPLAALPPGPFPSRLHEAAALAEWVRREVRYTGLLFGEGAVVPSPPAEVARRKFGDCKDQATLLVAALQSRGFDAAIALLRAGENPDVTAALPSLDAFDHAIVHVAGVGGGGVFVDTTSRFERFGEVPVRIQGRLALVCRPGTTGLVRIPVAGAAANSSRTETVVRIPEAGPPTCTEKTVYSGAFESNRRETFDEMAESDRKEYFERWAGTRFRGGSVTRSHLSEPRDLSGPFTLEAEVEKPGLVQAGDERVLFSVGADTFLNNLPDPEEGERHNDLVVVPVRQEFEYTLLPPPGFAPLDLPAKEAKKLGPASYTVEASARPDGSVFLRVVVEIASARLSPDETSALGEGLADLRASEPIAIAFLHQAEVAAARGEPKRGIEILKAEIRLDPTKAAPHRRLARLYLSCGLGDAARREAREGVRKEPKSAGSWFLLGSVLERDTWGRLRRKGWDPDEAEKALRKAVEIEPEGLDTRFELAILLEYDGEGTRYADPARLERALAEYEELLEKAPGLTVVARNYAFALLRADKPAALVSFLEKRSDADQMSGLRIAAMAGARGPEKALEQLRRDSPEPGARRMLASEIGGLLLVLRRYPEAAAFLKEASRGGEGAAAAGSQADAARLLRRVEGPLPAPGPGDPVSAVRAYMAGAFSPGSSVEDLAKLFVAPVREARDAAGKSPLLESIRQQRNGVIRLANVNAVSLAFVRDGLLAGGDLAVDGSATKGWLVSGTFLSAGRAPTRMRAWLAEEEGLPRLVSDDGRSAMLCWYALGLAARGDSASAREWLARASRELESPEDEVNLLLDPLLPRFPLTESASVREVRAAALAGLSETALPDPLFQEVRGLHAESPGDPLRAAVLFRALVAKEKALPKRGGKPSRVLLEEALGLLETIRSDRTTAEGTIITGIEIRARIGQESAALAAAEEHSLTHESCRFVGPFLVSLRLAAGDEAGALAAADRLMLRPSPTASDANTAAWLRFAIGRTDDKALSLARQAVEGTRSERAGVLNTLAAICAELGRNEEAHALVLRSMELEGLDEPFPGDWLVVGRIRENFGLVDDALAAYAHLAGSDDESSRPDSVQALGARRVAALKAESRSHR